MEVTGKHLLSSANTIIKNKSHDKAPASSSSARTSISTQSDQAPGINSHVLRIQASLNQTQAAYTKEQARMSWLENPNGKPEDMKFDGQPLFPDFPYGQSMDEFKQEVSNNIGELGRTLKGLQIEMENVFALNFDAAPNLDLNAQSLAAAKGLSSLDPGRVAQLTR